MNASVKWFMAIMLVGSMSHLSAARADSFDIHVGRGGVAFGMDVGMPPPVRVVEVPAYPPVRYVAVPAYREYVEYPPYWRHDHDRREWHDYRGPQRYYEGGDRYRHWHHEDDDD